MSLKLSPLAKKMRVSPARRKRKRIYKEQELYQLIGSPEAGVARIEVFDADTDSARFVMSKKMEPREDEKGLLPEGSVMTATMQGTRRKGTEGSYWEVTGAKFDMGSQTLRLKDILPEDFKLVLDKDKTDSCSSSSKAVSLSRLSEINNVVTLLHEAGHAHHTELEEELAELKKTEISESESMDEVTEKFAKLVSIKQKCERDAWAFAHQTARRAGWPLQKIIRVQSAEALATYDVEPAMQLLRANYDQFASSEQRRAMRRPKKLEEAKRLQGLDSFTRDVPDVISFYLDMPLDKILRKDEARGGKSLEIHFRVPEENKNYVVGIHQLETDDVMHRRVNDLIMTETSMNSDGEPKEISIVGIHGTNMASVTEYKVKPVGEDQPAQLEVQFDGKLGLLAANKMTKNPAETFQKAKALLDNFEKDTVSGNMIIAAFQEKFADAPLPPEYDTDTGRKLAIEEKVEYMKNTSRIYQMIEELNRKADDIVAAAEEESKKLKS